MIYHMIYVLEAGGRREPANRLAARRPADRAGDDALRDLVLCMYVYIYIYIHIYIYHYFY